MPTAHGIERRTRGFSPEVVEVVREDDHHRRRRDADEEGELRDVESPGHVAGEPRDRQAALEL